MAVVIANGTGPRLVRQRSSVLVQVKSTQTAASVRGLALARIEIGRLEAGPDDVPHLRPGEFAGPKCISEIMPTPHGPMLYLDLGEELPAATIRRIPELIVQALHRTGVTEAVVCCPRSGGPLDTLCSGPIADRPYPRGAGMLLWAPMGTPAPDSWIAAAMSWLTGLDALDTIGVDISGVQFKVNIDDARGLFRQVLDARSACLLVAGNLRRRVRTVYASTSLTSRLTLAERGPEVTEQDKVRGFEDLTALGRQLGADVEYAAVDLDVGWDFSAQYQCGIYIGRFERQGTELVEGVYPWQLIGEGHRARLPATTPYTPLPVPGRYELKHGRAEQWLPGQRSRAQLQKQCRKLLRNCLD